MTAAELTVLILVALACVTCVSITIIFERRAERRKESGTIYIITDPVDGETYMQLALKDSREFDSVVDGKKKKVVLTVKKLKDAGDRNE